MGDADYEKEYLQRKKKLRDLHTRLKDTKHVQEIYHKIMGSNESSDATESNDSSDEDL